MFLGKEAVGFFTELSRQVFQPLKFHRRARRERRVRLKFQIPKKNCKAKNRICQIQGAPQCAPTRIYPLNPGFQS
jgi:hypothetical protein